MMVDYTQPKNFAHFIDLMDDEALARWRDHALSGSGHDVAEFNKNSLRRTIARLDKAESERDALRGELRKCHDVLRRLRDFDGWDGTYHAGHALDARNDGRAILDASLARHGLAVKEVG